MFILFNRYILVLPYEFKGLLMLNLSTFLGFYAHVSLVTLMPANTRIIYHSVKIFAVVTHQYKRKKKNVYFSYFHTRFIFCFSIFLNKHLESIYSVLSIWHGCMDIVFRTNVSSEQNMKATSKNPKGTPGLLKSYF